MCYRIDHPVVWGRTCTSPRTVSRFAPRYSTRVSLSQLHWIGRSITSLAYVALETPATMFLRTLRPSRFIPGVTVLWGIVVLGSGFSKNYATQVAVRVLLGAMESALSPCLFLWMTTFYKRNEMASRSSYLYVAAPLSGIFGGLVVSGLS